MTEWGEWNLDTINKSHNFFPFQTVCGLMEGLKLATATEVDLMLRRDFSHVSSDTLNF